MLLEIPELPMTIEDFETLPNIEGVRYELAEGSLVMMSAFYAAWHGEMIRRLANLFIARGHVAFPARGIRTGHQSRRGADVGVFHKALPDLGMATHDSSELSHVVEVTSPDDRDRDWHEKAREYAAAGIPEYWIVENHESDDFDGVVFMHRLALTEDGHRYDLYRRATLKELEAEAQPL